MTRIDIKHSIIELIDITLNNDDIFEPLCDIFEKYNKIYIEFEIPNLDRDNLKIELYKNMLIVVGRKRRNLTNKVNYIRAEIIFGAFKKRIELPYNVSEEMDVTYEDGILRIIINKG